MEFINQLFHGGILYTAVSLVFIILTVIGVKWIIHISKVLSAGLVLLKRAVDTLTEIKSHLRENKRIGHAQEV